MHVVLLTIDFSRRGSGGIGSYVHTLATGLVRRGHHVTVASPNPTGRSAANYDVLTVPVAVSRAGRRPEAARCFLDAVLKLHARRGIDVIEATDYGLEGLACMDELDDQHIPTVVRMHTPDSLVCELNGEVRLSDSPAVHAHEADYFRRAKHISSPSRAMARELHAGWGVGGDHVAILPNPVELPSEVPASERPVGGGRFRLAFFGRLEQRKGTLVMAAALAEALPSCPTLEVDFIGADTRTSTGPHSRQIRALLSGWEDRVHFSGFISGDEKRRRLCDADAVCMPSLWENFPYACLEALSLGKSVIATSGSGFEEIIDQGTNGLLVPPYDPVALAQTIRLVVEGGFAPPPEALAARTRELSVEAVVPRFEEYYAGLAA